MVAAIRTRIVKIGNSQGIRIPKLLLEQSGIGEEVEIVLEDGDLVLRAAPQLRQGWAEAFATMAAQGDDRLLDESTPTAWDDLEWDW
jgi:antitoxin MazE